MYLGPRNAYLFSPHLRDEGCVRTHSNAEQKPVRNVAHMWFCCEVHLNQNAICIAICNTGCSSPILPLPEKLNESRRASKQQVFFYAFDFSFFFTKREKPLWLITFKAAHLCFCYFYFPKKSDRRERDLSVKRGRESIYRTRIPLQCRGENLESLIWNKRTH